MATKQLFLVIFLNVQINFAKTTKLVYNKFPKDFQFGIATSAYQIEGAWNASGKSESIWDYATHTTPEHILDGSNGDVACDSYNKLNADIKCLKLLNVDFYRFSISWARLLPHAGNNFINPDAVRYYNELIDKLIANKIVPMITLYHWDMPQSLQDLGGWSNRLIVDDFAQLARSAFGLFGDRVKTWITINEPYSVCGVSHELIKAAPFVKSPGVATYLCSHNLLLAHAAAYHIYKNEFYDKQKGKVGITVESPWFAPATDSERDLEAANRFLQMHLDWYIQPIFSPQGDYPPIMRHRIDAISKAQGYRKSRLPHFTPDEINSLKNSADFLGLNHYTSFLVADSMQQSIDPMPSFANDAMYELLFDPSWNKTARDLFKVYPEGFRFLLNYIKDKYNNPVVYITENGYAGDLNETTEDDERIWYYSSYLKELLKAIHDDNCNVKSFTAWSLMDNFEWSDGYTLRFGSFYVDFKDPSRTRVPKKSVHFLRRIFSTHRLH